MSIDTFQTDIEALALARAEGRPLDAEIAKRVHERAEKVRDAILKTHGVQDIGVEIIRSVRESA